MSSVNPKTTEQVQNKNLTAIRDAAESGDGYTFIRFLSGLGTKPDPALVQLLYSRCEDIYEIQFVYKYTKVKLDPEIIQQKYKFLFQDVNRYDISLLYRITHTKPDPEIIQQAYLSNDLLEIKEILQITKIPMDKEVVQLKYLEFFNKEHFTYKVYELQRITRIKPSPETIQKVNIAVTLNANPSSFIFEYLKKYKVEPDKKSIRQAVLNSLSSGSCPPQAIDVLKEQFDVSIDIDPNLIQSGYQAQLLRGGLHSIH